MLHRLLVAVLVALLLLSACQRPEEKPPPAAVEGAAPGTVVAAVKGALSISDPLARAATLAAVFQGLGPDAVGEVAEAYEDVTWSMQETMGVELALLAEWWGRHDPAGAYAWFRARGWIQNPVLMRVVVRAWATQDPAAARKTVDSALGRDRRRLVAALAEGWFESGQDGLEDYLAALPPGEERQLAIAYVARRRVLRDGSDATLRWAEALPDDAPGRFKLQAYRRVASAVAEVEPQRAAAWVERQLSGDYWDGLARRVAVRWARQDGEAALAWLETLPPEKLGTAVDEAYRIWFTRDRERARAWIQHAEGNPVLQPAVGFYALSVAPDDPAAGLSWAAKLSDETLRHRTLVRLGRGWMARDPEAARAWLAGSELDPTERQQVLAPGPGTRKRSPQPERANPHPPEGGVGTRVESEPAAP